MDVTLLEYTLLVELQRIFTFWEPQNLFSKSFKGPKFLKCAYHPQSKGLKVEKSFYAFRINQNFW